MRIRKPQTIFTHGIKIRCFKRAILVESTDITISHIIRKDIDHIWFLIHFYLPPLLFFCQHYPRLPYKSQTICKVCCHFLTQVLYWVHGYLSPKGVSFYATDQRTFKASLQPLQHEL